MKHLVFFSETPTFTIARDEANYRETMPSSASANTRPKREMKVLSLGLIRTGSASIAEALTILGYKDVYHSLKSMDSDTDWHVLNRACDASFPNLPSYTNTPFTRKDWDELYGHCEATTDVSCFWGPELIEAYPGAKVILVVRDYDKWFKSVCGIFDILWSIPITLAIRVSEPLTGSVFAQVAQKSFQGFFRAMDKEGVRANAREAYDRHHRAIMEVVPQDKLLLYKLGDGWGPLCEFLDKPVPDVEFPWVNEAKAVRQTLMRKFNSQILDAGKIVAPWVVAAAAVGYASWMMVRRYGVLGG